MRVISNFSSNSRSKRRREQKREEVIGGEGSEAREGA